MNKNLIDLAASLKARADLFSKAVHPFFLISGWTWLSETIPPTANRIADNLTEKVERWEADGYHVPYYCDSGGLKFDVYEAEDGKVDASFSFIFEDTVYGK